MRSPLTYLVLGMLLPACAPSVQMPVHFPGTGSVDGALDCAASVLEDDDFVLMTRIDDAGVLTAQRGREWVNFTVVPREPLVNTMQIQATRGARRTAEEIVANCGA